MTDSDKRSVATDALETLGNVIDESAGGRDAIHIAVEPVTAAHLLRPGDHVGLMKTDVGVMATAASEDPVGIVDPFISGNIKPGQMFWLLIYPRKITSLRHVWSHPAFDEDGPLHSSASPKEASEKWLRDFCASADCPGYEEVVAAALRQVNGGGRDGEYLHFNDRDAHGEIPPEFWHHIEVAFDVEAPKESRASYFSCAC